MKYSSGSIIKGTISQIAFGGKGILRTEDNFVVFVPYTAPQDVILCRLTKVKKAYAEAELIEIQVKSPFRIIPKCPYFGRCGGCQLQHLEYQEQINVKGQAIKDSLRKFAQQEGQFPFIIHPAERQWHYRRHIHLTLQTFQNRLQAGYIADDHHTFLPINVCPIFVSIEDPIISEIQDAVSAFSTSCESGKVMVVKEINGDFLLHFHFKNWSQENFKVLEKTKNNHPHWKSLIVSSATKTVALGSDKLSATMGPLSIHYSSSSFMQNHPEESMRIYQTLTDIANTVRPKNILDLYCGIGISSLLVSAKADRVIGIEENAKAIEMAKLNAKENGITNTVFKKGKVETLLSSTLGEQTIDFVILNPPRIGLEKSVITLLLEKQPKDIVYVSCMPSTLARDVKFFLEAGYEIQQCQAFDMFPQTAHVETLIYLKKSTEICDTPI